MIFNYLQYLGTTKLSPKRTQKPRPDGSDVLHDLLPFVQFKKHEKHPWKSVTFSKVTGFSLQFY